MELISQATHPQKIHPARVIQFGDGNFLRGFFNWQVQQMNDQGLFNGSSVVVQVHSPKPNQRLLDQDNLFTVILEGLQDGNLIHQTEIIASISQMINCHEQWEDYLSLAHDDQLEFIVSNTTEAGLTYDARDELTDRPPHSFPAKLTALLFRRFQLKKAGFTIIPCELVQNNGEILKQLVENYAKKWHLPREFFQWLHAENIFCQSLVDRIVPGYPTREVAKLEAQLGYHDQVMVKAEPFMLWVIEGPADLTTRLPLAKAGLNVIVTDDLTPYHTQKVHLLNGPHTALVPLAQLSHLTTVGDVMNDADFSPFLAYLFNQELIPMLPTPQVQATNYAKQTTERFANPFVAHKLSSISLNSVSKYKNRLLPIVLKHLELTNQMPEGLTASLAALILTYRNPEFEIKDDPYILEVFQKEYPSTLAMVRTILSDEQIWSENLTKYPPFLDSVVTSLEDLNEHGSRQFVHSITEHYTLG